MDWASVRKLVEHELATYKYEPANGTLGQPWSPERVQVQITALEAALVTPSLAEFQVRDTTAELRIEPPRMVRYWIVARDAQANVVFYDPQRRSSGSPKYGPMGTWKRLGFERT